MQQSTDLLRIILHADMDAFFASIEQRDNPELQGKPVIVGAQPGHRGVVSAASYEARQFGIHSAMPVSQAWVRCPQGKYVQPRMKVYTQESRFIMSIFRAFAPLVEQVSVDEAFLDISGTGKLWGSPAEAAVAIQKEIWQQRRLTSSIGIAPNKFLAKIASDFNKPNGITEVPVDREGIVAWLSKLPIERMWGIGRKSREVFYRIGVKTIGDLQRMTEENLHKRLGKAGKSLYHLARGEDFRTVGGYEGAKSISREHTFGSDTDDVELWRRVLLSLSRSVSRQARNEAVNASTIVFTWRLQDFSRHSCRMTRSAPTHLAKHIYEGALELMEKAAVVGRKLRLIGVGITNFDVGMQQNLFDNWENESAWEASEAAMDALNKKFGRKSIFKGGESGLDMRPRC
ncbi:MAG: DNA polymerase IV [Chitinivibrionales bacterium]|nr:DNA polymerase IV [Chitinivibrionales bacterium]